MERHFLVIGIGVIGLTFVAVFRRGERNPRLSFSMHAAQSLGSYLTFALGLTTAIACFIAWFFGWLQPQFHPGWFFTSVFFTSLLLLFVAAWVRWEKGIKGRVHDFAAYRMAYLMPVLPAIVMFSQQFPLEVRFTNATIVCAQLILLYLLIFVPALRRRFLSYQLTYIALTFIALIVATYR